MKIETNELRAIMEKLFNHLDEIDIHSIEFPYDYYWDIPKEDLYDSYHEPSRHTIGQLSDNWNDLRKLLNDSKDPVSSDFVDAAAILKAMGQILIG
jgi:hypothetical protein